MSKIEPITNPTNSFLNGVPIGYMGPAGYPGEITDEVPLSHLERTMRGVLRNDASYEHFLKSHDWQVERLPGYSGVFKVRRNKDEQWKVSDRLRAYTGNLYGDIGEATQDLLDMTGDLMVGVGATAGAMAGALLSPILGPVGPIGGAGVGGAAGEYAAQEMERLVPGGGMGDEPLDTDAIQAAGVGSALFEGAFRGVGAVATKVAGPMTADMMAGLSGIRKLDALPRKDVLIELAGNVEPLRGPFGGYRALGHPVRSFRESIEPIRAFFAKVKDEGTLRETTYIRAMLDDATQKGEKLSLGELGDFLRSHMMMKGPEVGKTISKRIISETEFNTSRLATRADVGMQNAQLLDLVTGGLSQSSKLKMSEGLGEVRSKGVRAGEQTTTRTTFEPASLPASEAAMRLSLKDRYAIAAFLDDVEKNILVPQNETWKAMSPNTADIIRSRLRDAGLEARSFEMIDERLMPLPTPRSRILNRGYGMAKGAVDKHMIAGSDGQMFSEFRSRQTSNLNSIDVLTDIFTRDEKGMEAAARWLYNAPTREAAQIAVADAARDLGLNIKWIKRANLQFAATGNPRTPLAWEPFTAINSPIGRMGLLGSMAAGTGIATRYGEGMAAGVLAAGITIGSSPRAAAYATRAGLQVAGAARTLAPATRVAGQTALATQNESLQDALAATKESFGIAREEPRPRRRTNLTGSY